MNVPVSSIEDIVKALKEHPQWRSRLLQELVSGSGELLRKLLREEPGLKEEFRKEILTEELLRLPAGFEASEEARRRDSQAVWEAIGRLTAAQERTEQHLAQLTARVDQLTVRLDQLTERVDQLTVRVDQLTVRLDQLTERVDQLTVRVDQLTVRLDQLTERVDQLTARMEQLTERVDQLTVRMEQLTGTVDWLAKRVGRIEQELGQHRGRHLEDAVCDRPWNYLGSVAKKTKALPLEDVKEMLRGVSEEDLRQLDRMDGCIEGKREGRSVLLAIEVSAKLESYDLERARLWAKILSSGLRGSGRYEAVLPVVVGYEAEEPLLREAERSGVWAVIAKELVVKGREELAR
jgi:chromosome segregation ATPase